MEQTWRGFLDSRCENPGKKQHPETFLQTPVIHRTFRERFCPVDQDPTLQDHWAVPLVIPPRPETIPIFPRTPRREVEASHQPTAHTVRMSFPMCSKNSSLLRVFIILKYGSNWECPLLFSAREGSYFLLSHP